MGLWWEVGAEDVRGGLGGGEVVEVGVGGWVGMGARVRVVLGGEGGLGFGVERRNVMQGLFHMG